MGPILLLGLVVMVLGMGGVVYWTDRTPVNRLVDRDAIVKRFSRDYPDTEVSDVWCSGDGNVALLLLSDASSLGLVVTNGDFEVTRTITGSWLRKLKEHSKGLRITTSDFSMPWLDIVLTEEARKQWSDRLMMLRQEGSHGRA